MARTFIFAASVSALLTSATSASAVGFLTQMNCASDYYAYCSQFQVGSPEVRSCMRRAGPKLSKSCLNALIADGEVSKAEVEQKKQQIQAAKAKQSAPAKIKSDGQKPKQKPTAVAKADSEQKKSDTRHAQAALKKNAKQRNASASANKLTLNQQTLAALKQRQTKFVDVAVVEDMSASPDPDKQVQSKVVDPVSSPRISRKSVQTNNHRRKITKKHRSEKVTGSPKAKTKLAAKKTKNIKPSHRNDSAKRLARN